MFGIMSPRLLFTAGAAALLAVLLLFPSSQSEAQVGRTLTLDISPKTVQEGGEVDVTVTISPPVTETVYLQVGDGWGGPGYASYCEGDYSLLINRGTDLVVTPSKGLNSSSTANVVTFKYKAERDDRVEDEHGAGWTGEKVPVSVSAELDPPSTARTGSNIVTFTITDAASSTPVGPRCQAPPPSPTATPVTPPQNPPPQNPPPQNNPPQNPPPQNNPPQNPPPQNNPPTQNQPPATNNPPALTGDTAISHAENDTSPVAAYTATDPEGSQITWSLSGSDGADFSIIRGDLTFNAGPDYEDPTDTDGDNVYHVTVKASDGVNTATLPVTVTVTDVNEAPRFPGNTTTRSVTDGAGAGANVGAPVEATDPEGDALTYSLGGTDAASFDITSSTGQLTTRAALDNSSYSVTVSVTDGKNASGNSDTTTDDTIDVTITVTGDGSSATSSQTTRLKAIPRQFVPINGGARRLLLSDHFSDSDDGYPPYQVTISDSAIATVVVSEGRLAITPKGIGVATTTLTVSDTPGIREVFKTIVYRPVVPRTNTETVHIVDPEVETTLTSRYGRLSVTFPSGAKDQFYQVAIDALSNECGAQSPVGERRMCVLVDLFDLGAESMEENLDVAATLTVSLDQQQYDAVQTDMASGSFKVWKGHGPTDSSWARIPQCENPRGSSECFSVIPRANGGKITVFNIMAFSQFDAGLPPRQQTPQPPSIKPPVGGSGSGNASRGDDSDSRHSSGPTLRVMGPARMDYPENDTGPVARYTIEESDVEGVVWSVYGDRKSFTISSDGVLSFRSPPDYEDPSGIEGNTYWAQIYAEAIDSSVRNDVLNVYVTVTQVNELGAISGDVELSAPENHAGAIARYKVDDPERGVITWTLSGPDALSFEIDSKGSLSPAGILDFEAPSSSALSNVHTLTITATDNGRPELSAQIDVTVTVDDVNEAPVAAALPSVDLTTEQVPWTLGLGKFFTDPDGDSLTYGIAGETGTGVAEAVIEDGTLSIAPVGGGTVSFEIAATDPGGLRAASAVSVSVTDTTPVATPAPAKVTEPAPTATPVPAKATEPAPTEPSAPVILLAAAEPTPAHVPLSERRYRNMTQQPDGVSKMIVAFAVETVESQPPELALPPLEATPVPAPVSPAKVVDDAAALQGQPQTPVSVHEAGGGLSLWVTVLLILAGLAVAGYAVRTIVIHRVSQSIWQGLSQMRHGLLPTT